MPSLKSIKISYNSPPPPTPPCDEQNPPPPLPPPPPPRTTNSTCSPCQHKNRHPPPPAPPRPPPPPFVTPPPPPPFVAHPPPPPCASRRPPPPPLPLVSPPPPQPVASTPPPPPPPPSAVSPLPPAGGATPPQPSILVPTPAPWIYPAYSPYFSPAPAPLPIAAQGGGNTGLVVGTSVSGLFFLSFLALGVNFMYKKMFNPKVNVPESNVHSTTAEPRPSRRDVENQATLALAHNGAEQIAPPPTDVGNPETSAPPPDVPEPIAPSSTDMAKEPKPNSNNEPGDKPKNDNPKSGEEQTEDDRDKRRKSKSSDGVIKMLKMMNMTLRAELDLQKSMADDPEKPTTSSGADPDNEVDEDEEQEDEDQDETVGGDDEEEDLKAAEKTGESDLAENKDEEIRSKTLKDSAPAPVKGRAGARPSDPNQSNKQKTAPKNSSTNKALALVRQDIVHSGDGDGDGSGNSADIDDDPGRVAEGDMPTTNSAAVADDENNKLKKEEGSKEDETGVEDPQQTEAEDSYLPEDKDIKGKGMMLKTLEDSAALMKESPVPKNTKPSGSKHSTKPNKPPHKPPAIIAPVHKKAQQQLRQEIRRDGDGVAEDTEDGQSSQLAHDGDGNGDVSGNGDGFAANTEDAIHSFGGTDVIESVLDVDPTALLKGFGLNSKNWNEIHKLVKENFRLVQALTKKNKRMQGKIGTSMAMAAAGEFSGEGTEYDEDEDGEPKQEDGADEDKDEDGADEDKNQELQSLPKQEDGADEYKEVNQELQSLPKQEDGADGEGQSSAEEKTSENLKQLLMGKDKVKKKPLNDKTKPGKQNSKPPPKTQTHRGEGTRSKAGGDNYDDEEELPQETLGQGNDEELQVETEQGQGNDEEELQAETVQGSDEGLQTNTEQGNDEELQVETEQGQGNDEEELQAETVQGSDEGLQTNTEQGNDEEELQAETVQGSDEGFQTENEQGNDEVMQPETEQGQGNEEALQPETEQGHNEDTKELPPETEEEQRMVNDEDAGAKRPVKGNYETTLKAKNVPKKRPVTQNIKSGKRDSNPSLKTPHPAEATASSRIGAIRKLRKFQEKGMVKEDDAVAEHKNLPQETKQNRENDDEAGEMPQETEQVEENDEEAGEIPQETEQVEENDDEAGEIPQETEQVEENEDTGEMPLETEQVQEELPQETEKVQHKYDDIEGLSQETEQKQEKESVDDVGAEHQNLQQESKQYQKMMSKGMMQVKGNDEVKKPAAIKKRTGKHEFNPSGKTQPQQGKASTATTSSTINAVMELAADDECLPPFTNLHEENNDYAGAEPHNLLQQLKEEQDAVNVLGLDEIKRKMPAKGNYEAVPKGKNVTKKKPTTKTTKPGKRASNPPPKTAELSFPQESEAGELPQQTEQVQQNDDDSGDLEEPEQVQQNDDDAGELEQEPEQVLENDDYAGELEQEAEHGQENVDDTEELPEQGNDEDAEYLLQETEQGLENDDGAEDLQQETEPEETLNEDDAHTLPQELKQDQDMMNVPRLDEIKKVMHMKEKPARNKKAGKQELNTSGKTQLQQGKSNTATASSTINAITPNLLTKVNSPAKSSALTGVMDLAAPNDDGSIISQFTNLDEDQEYNEVDQSEEQNMITDGFDAVKSVEEEIPENLKPLLKRNDEGKRSVAQKHPSTKPQLQKAKAKMSITAGKDELVGISKFINPQELAEDDILKQPIGDIKELLPEEKDGRKKVMGGKAGRRQMPTTKQQIAARDDFNKNRELFQGKIDQESQQNTETTEVSDDVADTEEAGEEVVEEEAAAVEVVEEEATVEEVVEEEAATEVVEEEEKESTATTTTII